jgi:hypothetical protein
VKLTRAIRHLPLVVPSPAIVLWFRWPWRSFPRQREFRDAILTRLGR